jgi:hypothetical protein
MHMGMQNAYACPYAPLIGLSLMRLRAPEFVSRQIEVEAAQDVNARSKCNPF